MKTIFPITIVHTDLVYPILCCIHSSLISLWKIDFVFVLQTSEVVCYLYDQ